VGREYDRPWCSVCHESEQRSQWLFVMVRFTVGVGHGRLSAWELPLTFFADTDDRIQFEESPARCAQTHTTFLALYRLCSHRTPRRWTPTGTMVHSPEHVDQDRTGGLVQRNSALPGVQLPRWPRVAYNALSSSSYHHHHDRARQGNIKFNRNSRCSYLAPRGHGRPNLLRESLALAFTWTGWTTGFRSVTLVRAE